ncbi:hypothetical protein BDW74DRAFT_181304 [Aspergillus multicolor]|uniref:uncharacterized protein n=1 Tax=Aspergillus multicolor TaxID=41759 RepID=UPI003CCD119C
MACSITHTFITRSNLKWPWLLNGRSVPFIDVLLAELGNESHLDRLTILLARPNNMKGSMFTGHEPIDRDKYKDMSRDEQLQAVKEMGIVFNYLNNREVTAKFCATYEAIHDTMAWWDNWNAARGYPAGTGLPSLQEEWKRYILVALDSLVLRARASFEHYLEERKRGILAPYDPPFEGHWLTIRFTLGFQAFRVPTSCNHMDR